MELLYAILLILAFAFCLIGLANSSVPWHPIALLLVIIALLVKHFGLGS